jgi:hypothetical protein
MNKCVVKKPIKCSRLEGLGNHYEVIRNRRQKQNCGYNEGNSQDYAGNGKGTACLVRVRKKDFLCLVEQQRRWL